MAKALASINNMISKTKYRIARNADRVLNIPAHLVLDAHKSLVSVIVFMLCFSLSSTLYSQDLVLTLRPKSTQFEEVFKGIKEALDDEFNIVDIAIDTSNDNRLIDDWITLYRPKAIILMDNQGVNYYLRYQRENASQKFPPTIIVSTLSADQLVPKVINSSAILYEVPAVTSLVDLRKMMVRRKIQRVGTIYRSAYKKTFEEQKNFCSLEQIELIGIEVDDDISESKLKSAIKKLKKLKTDAIWVMNDPGLMSESLLKRVWIPQLKRQKQPIVVGIKILINTRLTFGDYAIYPDQYELGLQLGDKLFDLKGMRWNPSTTDIFQPISLKKSINVHRLNLKGISYQKSYLSEFEQVITK